MCPIGIKAYLLASSPCSHHCNGRSGPTNACVPSASRRCPYVVYFFGDTTCTATESVRGRRGGGLTGTVQLSLKYEAQSFPPRTMPRWFCNSSTVVRQSFLYSFVGRHVSRGSEACLWKYRRSVNLQHAQTLVHSSYKIINN